MSLIPNVCIRKTTAIHAKAMDMMCCGNSAPIKIEPKLLLTYGFFHQFPSRPSPSRLWRCLCLIDHHCSCSRSCSCDCHDCRYCNHKPAARYCKDQNILLILVTALNFVFNQNPVLMVKDIPLAIMVCTFMPTRIGDDTPSPNIAGPRNAQYPHFKLNHLWSR